MTLSSLQLEAFASVAKFSSFSKAALDLHITQSALSQRIINLEDELETTLFIRGTKSLTLTEVGERLLNYSLTKESLEQEFLSSLKAPKELSGIVKIGSFSTYTRSILIPKLAPFLRKHPKVQIELMSREVRELPELLISGQVQYIFSTEKFDKKGVHAERVGNEENVLVESSRHKNVPETYIDHDEHDPTLREFFKLQTRAPKDYKRIYFDDIYGIIDGVEQGLGRAVVPKHLVESNKKVRCLKNQKALVVPIHLHYFEQSFYSKLHQEIQKLIGHSKQNQ